MIFPFKKAQNTPPSLKALAAAELMEQASGLLDLAKAEGLGGDVSIEENGSGYEPNFQRGANRVPGDKEIPTGPKLAMSGLKGPSVAHDHYSGRDVADVLSGLAELYNKFEARLDKSEATQKSNNADTLSVMAIVCDCIGQRDLAKAIRKTLEDSDTTKKEEKDEGDEADKQDAPTTKSLREMFDLIAGRDNKVNPPPDFSAALTKSHGDGPTDEEIGQMSCEDATEALCQRQRKIMQARVASGELRVGRNGIYER